MVIVIAPGRLIVDAEIVIDPARAVGAGIILLSERLVGERLPDDVTVAIHVPEDRQRHHRGGADHDRHHRTRRRRRSRPPAPERTVESAHTLESL
ncbi:hypothetical protein E1218_20685 [Kribbella turkmenica]|uniref:Uncharacterized protein n=1 Tax=Kribbella turkmenica TaxID=2530375 RepID=A0A4R4WV47_9ACTN|nr:hypothetical protein [Kribbella turkmenica]TDD21550.1 hypothetical protein E1218_20685 [Kribbella turkmenica]